MILPGRISFPLILAISILGKIWCGYSAGARPSPCGRAWFGGLISRPERRSARHGTLAEPGSEFLPRQRAGGEAEHPIGGLMIACLEAETVSPPEDISSHETRSLVSINNG